MLRTSWTQRWGRPISSAITQSTPIFPHHLHKVPLGPCGHLRQQPVPHLWNNTSRTQRRHKSVFVSKHNQSLAVTAPDILRLLPASTNHRQTQSHVILEECPFCTKPTQGKPDNQYKLYIQLGGGTYFCHRCGQGGSWFDWKRRLGDTSSTTTAAAAPSTAPTTDTVQPLPLPPPKLQSVYTSQLLDNNNNTESDNDDDIDVLRYLTEERGLTERTLRVYGVGRHDYRFQGKDGGWTMAACVTFPWIMKRSQIEHQERLRGVPGDGLRRKRCGDKNDDEDKDSDAMVTRRIKARAIESKSWQRLDPAGGGWGFFGYHTLSPECREVVLTEGEYDAMAVWQATGRPAISLPNGCRSLPIEALPLLEEFDRIYLWMDNDAAGRDGAELFAKKIGLGRCYLVRPTPENCDNADILPKDANEALLDGCDLEKIIADAKLTPHERVLQFSDFEDEVLHEILFPEKYVGTPMTSLPKFTKVIQGMRRGELTVITGPTGSGKTTFLGQMSLDLVEQDKNVLWGSFEIRNTRLARKLLQQYAREPLPVGDKTREQELKMIAQRFKQLPMHFLKFHGGSEVDDVLEAMEYSVYVHDCQHIFLDNLQFMISRQATSNSSFDKFDAQDVAIEKFRKFATKHNVHITLVVHPKKEDDSSRLGISSIYGSAKATQEADTVIILQHQNNEKFLDVRKNRFNGELGQVKLFFDRISCRYAESPKNSPNTSSKTNSESKVATPPNRGKSLDSHMDDIFT